MKKIIATLALVLAATAASADVEGECTFSEVHTTVKVACGKKLDLSGWRCWKSPSSADSAVVDSNFTTYPFSQVASFDNSGENIGYFCGIKVSDGSMLCWANNGDGVTGSIGTDWERVSEAPAGTGFKDVDAALTMACAIQSDDTILCWGRESYSVDQCQGGVNIGDPCTGDVDCPGSVCTGWTATSLAITFAHAHSDPPSGGYKQISCDDQGYNCCGITTSNAIDCFGDMDYQDASVLFSAIPAGSDWDRVEVSNESACAHRSTDNHVECWGDTSGSGTDNHPDPPAGAYFIDIGTAQGGGCARRVSDSHAVCWGPSWLTEAAGIAQVTGNPQTQQAHMHKSLACFFNQDELLYAYRPGSVRCFGRSYGARTPPTCDYIWPPSTTSTTTTLPRRRPRTTAIIN